MRLFAAALFASALLTGCDPQILAVPEDAPGLASPSSPLVLKLCQPETCGSSAPDMAKPAPDLAQPPLDVKVTSEPETWTVTGLQILTKDSFRAQAGFDFMLGVPTASVVEMPIAIPESIGSRDLFFSTEGLNRSVVRSDFSGVGGRTGVWRLAPGSGACTAASGGGRVAALPRVFSPRGTDDTSDSAGILH